MSSTNLVELQKDLEDLLRPLQARGTLIIAPEGINGTICFPREHQKRISSKLQERFPHLRTRVSVHSENVFFRLKVRIKTEIVTLGVDLSRSDPTIQVGMYVDPGRDWDQLLQDPDCMVVDTRNQYEHQVGTFRNAVNPRTQSFVEFPHWLEENRSRITKAKKLAFFCTGGIRCEKATAFCIDLLKDMPKRPEVYHLKGGILGYLEEVPAEDSSFQGECFVFDRRTAVKHGLAASDEFVSCHACRTPLSKQDRDHPDFEEGISCHACVDKRRDRRERYAGRQQQMKLNRNHLDDRKERKFLNRQKYDEG